MSNLVFNNKIISYGQSEQHPHQWGGVITVNKNMLSSSQYYKNVMEYANQQGYDFPSKDNVFALKKLIIDLENAGIIQKLDLLYIFSGDGDINFKLINIVNPGVYDGTAYGGLEWTADGVKGNGVNGYIDLNINLADVDINKYQILDASRGAFLRPYEQSFPNSYIDSTAHGNTRRYNTLIQAPANNPKINSSSTIDARYPTLSNRAFISHNRTESNKDYTLFLTGGRVESNAIAIDNFNGAQQMVMLADTRSWTYSANFTIMLYFIGKAIDESQRDLLVGIYNNYLTNIGLPVLGTI